MREKQRQLLIQLRSELIAEKETLPYCIYTDETIEDLLDAAPKSIEELVKVKGFPEKGKRVKGFGEAIVNVFVHTQEIEKFTIEKGGSGLEVGTGLKRAKAF